MFLFLLFCLWKIETLPVAVNRFPTEQFYSAEEHSVGNYKRRRQLGLLAR